MFAWGFLAGIVFTLAVAGLILTVLVLDYGKHIGKIHHRHCK